MEKRYDNNEIEIDVKALFYVLLKRWFEIVLCGVLLAGISFFVTKYVIQPEYKSTTAVYIMNKQNEASITYTDLQIGTQISKDYVAIVKSRAVIEQVIEELQMDTSYEGFLEKLQVDVPEDTRMLKLTITDRDPKRAMEIANKVRVVAAKKILEVMDLENINLVEEANLPLEPSSPNVKKNTLLGGLFGILLMSGIVIGMYLLNDNIKNSDDVERYLGLSTLGSIPIAEGEQGNKRKQRRKTSKKKTRKRK